MKKRPSSTRRPSKVVVSDAAPIVSYLAISPRGTITLPKRFRQHIQMVSVHRREDGVIELHPKIAVDESQSWFWTERWQKMEKEAEAEIRSGKVKHFDDVEEFIKDLDS